MKQWIIVTRHPFQPHIRIFNGVTFHSKAEAKKSLEWQKVKFAVEKEAHNKFWKGTNLSGLSGTEPNMHIVEIEIPNEILTD